MRRKDIFIFTHIPKTSGSSIVHILREEHKNKNKVVWSMDEDWKSLPDCISAHAPYGLHERWGLSLDRVKYITILRNPIDRWKSFLRYIIRHGNKKDLFHKHGKGSLPRFMRWCLSHDCNKNIMVKMISGFDDSDNLIKWEEHKKEGREDYFNRPTMCCWGGRRSQTPRHVLDDLLSKAKNNLLNKYYYVGFQEDRNNQKKMCEMFGVKYPKKGVFRRSTDRKIDVEWDEESEEMLAKLNEYDMKLYKFAKGKIGWED
jgi:hypothetical protein